MLVHAFVIILSIGVSTPPQKRHPLFSPKPSPPVTLQTVQAPLFRQFLPICCFFMNPPPSLKEMDFSVNSDNIKTFHP